jgi:hypothetical protein
LQFCRTADIDLELEPLQIHRRLPEEAVVGNPVTNTSQIRLALPQNRKDQ